MWTNKYTWCGGTSVERNNSSSKSPQFDTISQLEPTESMWNSNLSYISPVCVYVSVRVCLRKREKETNETKLPDINEKIYSSLEKKE